MIDNGAILRLVITLLLLPIWIALCFVGPYLTGKAFNRLLLRERAFPGLSRFFTLIAATGFLFLFVFLLATSIIGVFSIQDSELLFKELFSSGVIANAVGVICSLAVGFSSGKPKA